MTIPQLLASRPHGPYIIAEIGVNHDGDPARAIELTHAAAGSGADAIKLQLFEPSRLMSRASRPAAYQAAAGETDPIAMVGRLALSIQQMAPVVAAAHRLGLHAIVTIFSVELVPTALSLPWDALKVASPDIIHKPLLDALSASGLPLLVSTGASTQAEVRRAREWLALPAAQKRLLFMQCVSSYPTPLDEAALDVIPTIAAITGLPAGYSDHTDDVHTGAHAVYMGAILLEKHLTYARAARGPDHSASLEPAQFARYAALARDAFSHPAPAPFIPAPKQVAQVEQDVRTVSRQSIVTSRALPAGHTLRRQDITFKRPGTGLPPFMAEQLLGRSVLARDIPADTPLAMADLTAAHEPLFASTHN